MSQEGGGGRGKKKKGENVELAHITTPESACQSGQYGRY
jgi:hypothetical protein